MKTQLIVIVFALIFFPLITTAQTRQDTINAYKAGIEQIRVAKDTRFSNPATSPIPDAQIPSFEGLSYFPVDYDYKLAATLIPADAPQKVKLKMSDGSRAQFLKFGDVVFSIDGKEYTLSVFQNSGLPEFAGNPSQLFIPFKDASSGTQSNKNGRYVSVSAPGEDNLVTLDFNLAMNPFGAYDPGVPSVIPPVENVMLIPLPTGERKYEDR